MTSQLEAMRERIGGRRLARSGSPQVLGVLSGKGGAGVSLIAAVLAIRSAGAGHRTLLVDADPWLDMQRIWLGLPKAPSLDTHPASGEDVESLIAPVHGDLALLSLGSGDAYGRDRRAVARRIPTVFAPWDAVVVDAGCRLESIQRCTDLRVGSALVVSSCDAVGLASTHALAKAMKERTEVPPTVLFNRVDRSAAMAAETVLRQGAERFLGIVPEVVGSVPVDTVIADGLAEGATLPEGVVSSALPGHVADFMSRLSPWTES